MGAGLRYGVSLEDTLSHLVPADIAFVWGISHVSHFT
jgi:hypothetical protein